MSLLNVRGPEKSSVGRFENSHSSPSYYEL